MRTNIERKKESGIVFLALLVVIVFGLAAAAFLYVKKAQTKKPMSTTAAEVVEAGGSAISRSAENVQRKNDAIILLSVTAEYIHNSQGQPPTALDASLLRGMGYYEGASIARGDQAPIAGDKLRLVTGAECADDGSAMVASVRSYVVQYAIKDADGSLTPQCIEA